jgi:hypothetical protein
MGFVFAGLTWFWHIAEVKGLVYWGFLLRDYSWSHTLNIPIKRFNAFLHALELP